MTTSRTLRPRAQLTQLAGGWWRAQEIGGFESGAVGDTAFQAWSALRAQIGPIFPHDRETHLWAVDARWPAVLVSSDVREPWGTHYATQSLRRHAELKVFGRVLS